MPSCAQGPEQGKAILYDRGDGYVCWGRKGYRTPVQLMKAALWIPIWRDSREVAPLFVVTPAYRRTQLMVQDTHLDLCRVRGKEIFMGS